LYRIMPLLASLASTKGQACNQAVVMTEYIEDAK